MCVFSPMDNLQALNRQFAMVTFFFSFNWLFSNIVLSRMVRPSGLVEFESVFSTTELVRSVLKLYIPVLCSYSRVANEDSTFENSLKLPKMDVRCWRVSLSMYKWWTFFSNTIVLTLKLCKFVHRVARACFNRASWLTGTLWLVLNEPARYSSLLMPSQHDNNTSKNNDNYFCCCVSNVS